VTKSSLIYSTQSLVFIVIDKENSGTEQDIQPNSGKKVTDSITAPGPEQVT